MERFFTENSAFMDKTHEEDLKDMLGNAYIDVDFFFQALTGDDTTYTYWGDVQKDVYFVSDNLRDRFGFGRNKVSGLLEQWEERIYNPIDRGRFREELKTLRTCLGAVHDMRYQVMDLDGQILWVHSTGRVKWDEAGTKPVFFCGKINCQDTSLMTDPVSDFAGEAILLNHLKSLDQRGLQSTCIGFCLNNISKINCVLGRCCGTRLIRSIAQDLQLSCPTRMPFYRLDGVRFLAVLSDTAGEKWEDMVEKIRAVVDRNYKKLDIALSSPCSFAVVRYPRQGGTGYDFLQNVIAMLDLASQSPGMAYLDESAEAVRQLQERDSMELLLNKNVLENMEQFRIVVQPVVSAATGDIIGGETLLRWRKDGQDISPAVFIPILEKSGLIQTAGRWVFEQSVITCKRVLKHLPNFYLSVNVSLRQLYDPGFLDFIPDTLKKHGLEGKHIVVEMTESCMDQEQQRVQKLFEVCEGCGIRIALDDFGTGYSSMQMLLRYPLSIVKIDRSLLLEISEDKKKYSFLSSIVYACHQFGMTVCIEGVETEKQRELSCYTGCDVIQGFYYYRPTEVDILFRMLEGLEGTSESGSS